MNYPDVALEYLDKSAQIIQRVRDTQLDAIRAAAELCAESIAKRGLVHLFGKPVTRAWRLKRCGRATVLSRVFTLSLSSP